MSHEMSMAEARCADGWATCRIRVECDATNDTGAVRCYVDGTLIGAPGPGVWSKSQGSDPGRLQDENEKLTKRLAELEARLAEIDDGWKEDLGGALEAINRHDHARGRGASPSLERFDALLKAAHPPEMVAELAKAKPSLSSIRKRQDDAINFHSGIKMTTVDPDAKTGRDLVDETTGAKRTDREWSAEVKRKLAEREQARGPVVTCQGDWED